MDHFEEDLTCSVCYSIFEDPRVLPCSHTFCRTCLENIVHESTNFSIWRHLRIPLKCPTCRSIVELPPVGISSLPINFSLMGIIEKYQKEEHPKTPTCSEHFRQPLNMFCLFDRKLVCGYCLTVGHHQGHPIDDLQHAYNKEKETCSKLVEQLTEKHWAKVSIFIEQLEHQRTQTEQTIQQDKETVIQYFENLQKIVESKKQAFLVTFDEISLRITSEYVPLIQKMQKLKEEQHDLLTFSTYLEDEKDPLAFLEKVHLYRQRVNNLMKTQLPFIRPLNIQPRAAQFLTEKWSKVTVDHIKDAPVLEVKHCLENHWNKDLSLCIKQIKGLSQRLPVLTVLFLLTLMSLGFLMKDCCVNVLNTTVIDLPQVKQMCDLMSEVCAGFHSLKAALGHSVQSLVNFFCQLIVSFPCIYQMCGFQLSTVFQYASSSLQNLLPSESHEQA
ncbi:tripartite motif-containing protein 59-like [Chiloscyllium plagiosum]|uniref:tripartite motif-containing protein 59-like n=1 Tax=Chiloscyllium plagiosum TaxID=36176 RepID=UPI001CB7DE53|nr:tripartite motif-containing protein 59-like [Chiloscyllium plagiosum]